MSSRRMLVAVALALPGLGVGAGAAQARLPGLLTAVSNGNDFGVRPAVVVYTGDGGGLLGVPDACPADAFPRASGGCAGGPGTPA